MLLVVLDPGVIVSGLISTTGAPRRLLERWLEGAFEILASPRLLDELSDVLLREKIRTRVATDEAMAFLELIRMAAVLRDDPSVDEPLTPDPGDDYLVALARAGDAACLVSGDRHLTELEDPYPPVLTPRALLGRLESPS